MSETKRESLLLTVEEAAALAHVGKTQAYSLCARGLWPVVKLGKSGRSVRVNRRRLELWIDANTVGADDLTPTGSSMA